MFLSKQNQNCNQATNMVHGADIMEGDILMEKMAFSWVKVKHKK